MALDPSRETSADAATPRSRDAAASEVIAALSVYVEPLVADARVAVLGDVELGFHTQLLDLGARSVHLYDPDPDRVARTADEAPRSVSIRMLRDDFDVRDGAFDLVVIPDVGVLPDPAGTIVRLRRVVDARGAVVALGRARTSEGDETIFPELAPAVVDYAELYDLFALQFENVTMTGVLPFTGVVFAELGAGDDLAVSVDTRLVTPEPPGVFVVLAGREETALDPYAIVQTAPEYEDDEDEEELDARSETARVRARARDEDDLETTDTVTIAAIPIAMPVPDPRVPELEAALATAQLQAEMLATQLDEHRARLVAEDGRTAAHESRLQAQHARLEQVVIERDLAVTRASELEGLVVAAERALEILEKRLVSAERGMLERDDRIAALSAELEARASQARAARAARADVVDASVAAEILTRAERAETALALHVADLAAVADAHASETAGIEEQLRDRARVIAAMERELDRREQLVRELVTSLEELREDGSLAHRQFEAAPAAPGVAPEEVARLRRRLDDLALEIARREGELVAQAWRITELENEKARLVSRPTSPSPAQAPAPRADDGDAAKELARARDELDALRQALTQEHAARLAAESGEELSRARAELERQSALLEQMRGRGAQPEG